MTREKTAHRITWQQEIAELLRTHGTAPAAPRGGKARQLGWLTAHLRRDHLYGAWRDLGKLGHQPESVHFLGERHIRMLVHYWEDKELSASTIQTRLTTLRTFAGWIGKKGMVRSAHEYVRNHESAVRHYAATTDKSWTTNNVSPQEIIDQVMDYDVHIGHQLVAIMAFGLRRKEGVFFKPWKADHGKWLLVSDGTKGGRERVIPINSEQREVLDRLKAFVGQRRESHLGDPSRTFDQAITRFAATMTRFGITKAKLGVTAHGLRHEAANDAFENAIGVPSPVRGGKGEGCSEETLHRARALVSELLGHSRVPISNAYLGSFKAILDRIRRERAEQEAATPASACA